MPRKTILLLVLSIVVLALSAAGQSATTVRVFNLKNASVIEAFTAIESLLSDNGSVTNSWSTTASSIARPIR